MELGMKIAFWAAVLMLVDAAIDLWGLNFFQRMLPNVNVRRLALTEALLALAILVAIFLLRAR